jgi:hypothetical protein
MSAGFGSMSSLNGNSQQHQQTPPSASNLDAGAVLPVGGLTGSHAPPGGSLAELRRRRKELAERVASLTLDLGGLAYEMAIRDHYRLDVIARTAAELQEADAQLGEVQRLLATAEAGIHGQCRSCGAVHSRGAGFCWHCGAPLLQEARPSVLGSDTR